MLRFSLPVLSRAFVETCLRFAVQQGTGWVRHQRHKHRRNAAPLSDEEFAHLSRFFEEDTLRSARIAHVPVLENPKLVGVLRLLGVGDTLDFGAASGVTYDDLILISQSRADTLAPMSLLFHEMVHVAQYRVLGVRGFIEHYMHGWANHGCAYLTIPLERDAYVLQARYDSNPQGAFSVEDEVRRRLHQGR
ncbi:MAG TPA: hypothetical protein VF600_00770 [Abditibacteriaceae bacterium]|jgi:hypothetical protein